MAYLSVKNGNYDQTLTLSKNNIGITLPIAGKYINKNINLTVNAPAASVGIAADATVTATPTITVDPTTGIVTAEVNTTEVITPVVSSAGWVSANSGISGGNVTIEGSSTYDLTLRTSADLTSNGATVYAPAGYYPAQASKAITSGTLQLTGGDLTASDGYASLASDGLYNATNGIDTSDKITLGTTAPTGSTNSYQLTVTGYGTVSRAKIDAKVTKNGYLSSSANKTDAATSATSNTATSVYYIPKATRTVTNGTITETPGSLTVDEEGIVLSAEETDYSLTITNVTNGISVGASSVNISAGYNPGSITANTTARTINSATTTTTKYIQAGAIAASVSTNTAGSASMAATGFTPLSSGTSSYYVTLSTTAGSVVATANTATEGYIKNATNSTSATAVNVNGNNTKLYIPAATLGSEGSVTTAPSVAITNSTTMLTTSTNTGYSFTVGGTPSNGTVQTKYKATVAGYTPTKSATNGGTVPVTPGVSGGTTVYVKASTLSNTATSGVTYTEVTGNTVVISSDGSLYINEGYTGNKRISLATLIPNDATIASNNSLLQGVTAYDSNGVLYTGTIPTQTALTVSGRTVTAAAGYYASNTSASVALGKVTSPTVTVGISAPTYDSSSGKFNITSSGEIPVPIINTTGYITADEASTRAKGSYSGSSQLNKISLKSTHSGKTAAVTPVISKQAISITNVVDAANGDATTTAPSSGVYVAVQSAKDTGTLTSTPGVYSAGYGTTTSGQYTVNANGTSTVGANASSITYIPIKTTSVTVNGNTVSYGSGWVASGSQTVTNGAYSCDITSHIVKTTPSVTGKLTGTITNIGTTTKPSGTNGTDYWTITPSGTAAAGSVWATGTASIDTAGWITAGSLDSDIDKLTVTPSVSDGTARYLVKAEITGQCIDASASTTVAPGDVTIAANTTSVSGKTRLAYSPSTATSGISTYYIAIKANAAANSTGATSSITGAVTVSTSTAGYAPLTLTGTGNTTGTATAYTSSKDSSVYYIPVPTAAFTTSGNKVYCSTAGYVPQGSTSNTVGTVSTGTITNNTTLPSGSTSTATINRGKYIKIGAGYYDSDKYYLAQANSGNYAVTGSGTGISVDGKKTISVAASTFTYGTTTVSTTTATRGTMSWTAGWATAGSLAAATFANSATADTEYVDISGTDAAPILISGDYLYINKGYTDNLKISLARLVPDSVNNVNTFAAAGQILSGYVAYNADGTGVTGTIPTKTSTDVTHSGKTVTIPAGYYASQVTHNVTSGAYSADSSASSNSTVTPSVALDTAATDSYGFTTTAPSSGTTGTNFLTINPEASATAWSVTPRAKITTAGYLPKENKNGTAVSNTPSIAAGTNYYVPVVSNSFSGGGISITTNYSKSDLAVTLASGSDTNMENITLAAKDTTNYPYYFKVSGSTPAVSGKTKATRAKATYTNSAGVIAAHSATQIWAADAVEPTVSVNAAAGSSYIGLKKATMTVAGTNTVTPSATVSSASAVTLGTTNNGLSVTATGGGTASVTATATTNVAGYAPASTQLGSATLSASSNTTTQTKYITAIAVPKSKTFTISTTANTAADTNALTVTNNAYRITNVTNNANGTTNVTNGGTATVTSASASTGTLTVNAYDNASTPALTGAKSIVSNGKWVITSVSAGGTYYGRVEIASGSASTNFANSGISTYFNSGTSSNYNVSITPRYSITAGYIGAATNTNGTTSYYKIKTAAPAFDGGALSGTATASSSTGASLSTSTNNSGITIVTACTATRANVLYNGAVEGWVSKADDAVALSSGSTAMTATTYYLNGVTVPKDKKFTLTSTADTALDTTSDITITNNAYRQLKVTNAANGNTAVTNSGTVTVANSGTTTVTSGSATAGTLSVNAYDNASTPALTGAQSVVSNGKWVQTNVSATGTFYGRVTVGAATISNMSGGGLSGTATASANSSSCSISSSTNNSGVSFTTACSATRAKVTCSASKAGFVASGTLKTLSATTTALTDTTYYINGVTLTAPTGDTPKTFSVTVPNGNASDTLTFTFSVDKNYNVMIT